MKIKKLTNLKSETICDYYVDSEKKLLWNIELNMLSEIMRVCNKYKIKYWVTAGTMLGAVRHKGFIPWDDDIDIGMLRKDYNKFIEVAKKEFKKPLFLQNSYEDNLFRAHAQLRKSDTTMMLKNGELYNYNQGIFIDIFPYDVIPKSKVKLKIMVLKIKLMTKLMLYYKNNPKVSFKDKVKYIISSPFFKIYSFKKFFKKFEICCGKYLDEEGMVSNFSFDIGRLEFSNDKSIFENFIEVPFEKLIVPIPTNYDEYLKTNYGNYMKFVKGGASHGEVFIDINNPYTKYLKNKIDGGKNVNKM